MSKHEARKRRVIACKRVILSTLQSGRRPDSADLAMSYSLSPSTINKFIRQFKTGKNQS